MFRENGTNRPVVHLYLTAAFRTIHPSSSSSCRSTMVWPFEQEPLMAQPSVVMVEYSSAIGNFVFLNYDATRQETDDYRSAQRTLFPLSACLCPSSDGAKGLLLLYSGGCFLDRRINNLPDVFSTTLRILMDNYHLLYH